MVTQALSTVLGIWLMFAPAVLGHAGQTLGKLDRGLGPFIASVSFLAVTQICRSLRWVNLLPAAVLLVAPWFLDGPMASKVNTAVVGLVVLLLTPWGHPDQSRYGNGWMTLGPLPRLPGWNAGRGEGATES